MVFEELRLCLLTVFLDKSLSLPGQSFLYCNEDYNRIVVVAGEPGCVKHSA